MQIQIPPNTTHITVEHVPETKTEFGHYIAKFNQTIPTVQKTGIGLTPNDAVINLLLYKCCTDSPPTEK